MADPGWLIEMAIEPKSRDDQVRLEAALPDLAASFSFGHDADIESGQFIISANDEESFIGVIDALKNQYGISMNAGAPSIGYRETIWNQAPIDYHRRKRSGSETEQARVSLSFKPTGRQHGEPLTVVAMVGAGTVAEIAAAKAGILSVAAAGPVAGYPVVDVEAQILDINSFEDPSSPAIEIAARAATQEAIRGNGGLVEPVMLVQITAPIDAAPAIVEDLLRRRGEITRKSTEADEMHIRALVPAARLFRYSKELNELSKGRASFKSEFSYFGRVSRKVPPG